MPPIDPHGMRFVSFRIIWLGSHGDEEFSELDWFNGEQFVVATEKYLQIKPLGSQSNNNTNAKL